MLLNEEYARSMVQRSSDAAVKDTTIKLRMEEYALNMVQRTSQTMQQRRMHKSRCKRRIVTNCALSMGQGTNAAAVKDAPVKSSKEDCVLVSHNFAPRALDLEGQSDVLGVLGIICTILSIVFMTTQTIGILIHKYRIPTTQK